MAARLKVFNWSDGFHAFTVAASSKPRALAAWGIGQDIFKSGLARAAPEGAARDAALAAPGEVIQTGEAVDVGTLAKAARRKAKTGPSAAQKLKVKALEQALTEMDAAQAATLDRLDEEIRDRQTRREALDADQRREREELVGRLRTARGRL